ncbi:hypothetical protein [Cellulomonas shaoxiangyii]|uniref:Uncharacterized protein n=1 Tax=Cellulomonas shaoxiangyii TaxID=2566013 RepID=A0A4P7SL71_9CELL|nr:hypothetical protein [Cellulomonas shaoxiangyii]QCB94661.1 hypothetical protein E5225_14945 [Cellulomonas shaoxiangyii]TGY84714.1 hypothetical protein E5226_09940 [Cellulomonas shaoxiangyii]
MRHDDDVPHEDEEYVGMLGDGWTVDRSGAHPAVDGPCPVCGGAAFGPDPVLGGRAGDAVGDSPGLAVQRHAVRARCACGRDHGADVTGCGRTWWVPV